MTNKFDLYECAVIARTGSPVDGITVKVLGVVVDQYPLQIIYIVQKEDESLFDTYPYEVTEKWKCISITSNCLDKISRKVPEISEESRKTFEAISDPKNAHLFTLEAALKAFSHVKPLDTEEK